MSDPAWTVNTRDQYTRHHNRDYPTFHFQAGVNSKQNGPFLLILFVREMASPLHPKCTFSTLNILFPWHFYYCSRYLYIFTAFCARPATFDNVLILSKPSNTTSSECKQTLKSNPRDLWQNTSDWLKVLSLVVHVIGSDITCHWFEPLKT